MKIWSPKISIEQGNMIYKADKLFNNTVSVRDYIVNRAKKFGAGLWIRYRNQQMYISKQDLDNGRPNGMKIPSKFNDSHYDLIDFPWKPRPKEVKDKNAEGQLKLQ